MEKFDVRNGAKVGATAIIWAFATGIMAICIPLVNISRSGIILPLAVIIGVSISTVAIWLSGNQKAVELPGDLQQIEQRMKDLETIYSREELNTKNQPK